MFGHTLNQQQYPAQDSEWVEYKLFISPTIENCYTYVDPKIINNKREEKFNEITYAIYETLLDLFLEEKIEEFSTKTIFNGHRLKVINCSDIEIDILKNGTIIGEIGIYPETDYVPDRIIMNNFQYHTQKSHIAQMLPEQAYLGEEDPDYFKPFRLMQIHLAFDEKYKSIIDRVKECIEPNITENIISQISNINLPHSEFSIPDVVDKRLN